MAVPPRLPSLHGRRAERQGARRRGSASARGRRRAAADGRGVRERGILLDRGPAPECTGRGRARRARPRRAFSSGSAREARMADPDLSRKQPEQPEGQLRPTEEQARTILDSIPVQIWTARPDGTFDYCNRQWRAYTGLSQEEFQAHGWPHTLHPDDKDRALKVWHQSVAHETPYEFEARHRRADGAYRWFLCRGLPLRDAEGRVERWYGANTDIEDRKRTEEALRQSERRLNEAQRIAHVGHWEHDLEARRITASDEAYRIFGSP